MSCRSEQPCHRPAFTLTELVVVLAILTFVVVAAAPVLSSLTGVRSLEQGDNLVSALLARTRSAALAAHQHRAVLLVLDAGSNRVLAAPLRETAPSARPASDADVWFDLEPGVDPMLLPVGIAAMTILGGRTDLDGERQTRGYVAFNRRWPHPSMPCRNLPGGLIAFTPDGRLFTGTAGLVWRRGDPTPLARLLWADLPLPGAGGPDAAAYRGAQVGLGLFDATAYTEHFGDDAWLDEPGYDAAARAREQWLDAHAVHLLVNRYTGTLMRGE